MEGVAAPGGRSGGARGAGLVTYNQAAREKTLWREPVYETRNPENVQDPRAGKLTAEESGVQSGHRTIDSGTGDFPGGVLPVRNEMDRGPDRQCRCAGSDAGAEGVD